MGETITTTRNTKVCSGTEFPKIARIYEEQQQQKKTTIISKEKVPIFLI